MLLAVDLGATKTLFALAERAGAGVRLAFARRYEDDAFDSFDAMAARFAEESRAVRGATRIAGACIGAAGPVAHGRVTLTNRDWTLDESALARRFGWARVRIVNDFAAAASGIEALAPEDVATLQAGAPDAAGARVVLGAGSGLGVAYAVPDADGWRVIPGEGGHRGFAPQTERQALLAAYWRQALGRVSDETVCSGPGIARLYAFERAQSAAPCSALDAALAGRAGPEAITQAAASGDLIAAAAVESFAEIYGQIAGDHALGVMATGGVYLAGGIAPRLLEWLRGGAFLRGFHAKGAQAAWMGRFPVHVVRHAALGLLGAAVIANRMDGQRAAASSARP